MNCSSGKRMFFSHSKAKQIAKKLKRAGGKLNLPVPMQAIVLRPYKCEECGFWHLTKGVNNINI